MAATVKLEIMTPGELFYSGDVQSVTVKTVSWSEGYLPGHQWCCKLLAASGNASVKDAAGQVKKAELKGGYIEVRDSIIVFSDEARWA